MKNPNNIEFSTINERISVATSLVRSPITGDKWQTDVLIDAIWYENQEAHRAAGELTRIHPVTCEYIDRQHARKMHREVVDAVLAVNMLPRFESDADQLKLLSQLHTLITTEEIGRLERLKGGK